MFTWWNTIWTSTEHNKRFLFLTDLHEVSSKACVLQVFTQELKKRKYPEYYTKYDCNYVSICNTNSMDIYWAKKETWHCIGYRFSEKMDHDIAYLKVGYYNWIHFITRICILIFPTHFCLCLLTSLVIRVSISFFTRTCL